jgi:hypothetical protein
VDEGERVMVRALFLLLVAFSLHADVYQTNCVSCHEKLPVSIDKYFYRYLLNYSSEKDVKRAMLEYLRKPDKQKSVMGESFINRFGVKQKSELSNGDLKKALNVYYETYKVFGKLK